MFQALAPSGSSRAPTGMMGAVFNPDEGGLFGWIGRGLNGTPLQQRIAGLQIFAVGLLGLLLNVVTVVYSEEYYHVLVVATPPILFGGGWIVLLGKPRDPQTGRTAGWWKAGEAACVIAGVALGLAACFVLAI